MATCAYMSIHECKEVTLIYKSISAFPGVGAMMCRKLVQWRSICAWFCSNGSSVNTSSIPHSRLISVAASWMRWMQQVLIWRQPWRSYWFDSVSFWFHWLWRDSKSCCSDIFGHVRWHWPWNSPRAARELETKKMRSDKKSSLVSLGSILEISMRLRLRCVHISIVVLWGWQKDNWRC